jgi:cell division septum initiation protein DivIVA
VEVNQANLLRANESLSNELDVVHRAYEEVVTENEILKDEVRRLMKCLEARERQFFEVTGRSVEAEEF